MDETVIDEASARLLRAVEANLAPWLQGRLVDLAPMLGPEVAAVAARCADVVLPELRELLATDIDQQRTTPLQLVRDAMAGPTAALAAAGVAVADRDPQQARLDPNDVYDLGPARWADLGEEVGDAGLMWGAAKAMVHLQRHRDDA